MAIFKKRRLIFNAGSSVIQIIVSSVTLFFLYRYLLETIGIEQLGIWSLVLAVSSIVQLGNFGLTGSIVKHVADFDAIGDKSKISQAIQTAVISIAVFSFFLIICAYPAAIYYFGFATSGESYQSAVKILPLAITAFWIMLVTNIYQSGLYGCQLILQRNMILIAESICHLFLCIILASRYGLIGLAYARIAQNTITLLTVVFVLKKHLRTLPFLPRYWSRYLFKEMLGYGVNLQVISLLVLLCDPLTKGLLSRYGSISMVGYYEMANKMVQQVRSLIVSANQVLVPEFARLNQLNPEKILDSIFCILSFNVLHSTVLIRFSYSMHTISI